MDAVFRELFLVVTRRRGEAVAAALAAMDFGFWRSILVAFALAFLGCFFLGAFTTDGLLADCKSADIGSASSIPNTSESSLAAIVFLPR